MSLRDDGYIVFRLTVLSVLAPMLSYFLALVLRFESEILEEMPVESIWYGLIVLICSRVVCYIFFGTHKLSWKYFSLAESINLLKSSVLGSLLFATGILIFRIPAFPRSIVFIELMLSVLLYGTGALLIRLFFERWPKVGLGNSGSESQGALILGGGDSGHLLVKTLLGQRRQRYQPVAVLDDSPRLRKMSVHGVKVLGPLNALERVLKSRSDISIVYLAIPSLAEHLVQQLEQTASRATIPFRRMSSFEDIALQVSVNEEPPIESLLNREIDIQHQDEIGEFYTEKTILVTGAAGSIGSELVRQLSQFSPRKIVLYDSSEFHLFQLQRELHDRFPDLEQSINLGDVRDLLRLEEVFERERPQVVFHAAALKHVPLNEINPSEAFKTNVLGTFYTISTARKFGAERFLLISTDKAVEPTSIMGVTKALAEIVVRQLIFQIEAKSPLTASIVRFGNVINSRGSVVPLFREQILSGGPLTVTHPEIERYFMSLPEAVQLVLAAGSLPSDGDIFVLDMGQKVQLADLAQKMLEIYGRPDIEIQYIGLRPGEKLTEELAHTGEELEATRFEKIRRIAREKIPLPHKVDEILAFGEVLSSLELLDVKQQIFTLLESSQEERAQTQL